MNTSSLKTLPVAIAFGLALASGSLFAKGNGTGMDAAAPEQYCVPTTQTTGSSAKAPQSHVSYDCAPLTTKTSSLAPGATTAKSPAHPARVLISGNAVPMGPGCTGEC